MKYWNAVFLVSIVMFFCGMKAWIIASPNILTSTNFIKDLIYLLISAAGLWGFVVSCQK